MFGGCSWSKREMGCLFSGSRYFSERSSATVKIDFFCILCAGRGFSTSFLFGWSLSYSMYLSFASITAASLLRCIDSMLVSIPHAAVGVDLSSPAGHGSKLCQVMFWLTCY